MGGSVSVFICCSEELRPLIADHLAVRLTRDNMVVCKDKDTKDLTPGKGREDEIRLAIQRSSFFVVILDSKFASSAALLNELLQIMEAGAKRCFVIFYHLTPIQCSDLKGRNRERSCFHGALKLLGDEYGPDQKSAWTNALVWLGGLVSWELSPTDYEAEVVREVADKIHQLRRT